MVECTKDYVIYGLITNTHDQYFVYFYKITIPDNEIIMFDTITRDILTPTTTMFDSNLYVYTEIHAEYSKYHRSNRTAEIRDSGTGVKSLSYLDWTDDRKKAEKPLVPIIVRKQSNP